MEPSKTVVRDKLYIGGAWVPSTGSGSIDVIDSTSEGVIGTVPEGTTEDIDRAVGAARAAFPAWSATPVEERTALLTRVGEALGSRMDELADLITHEVGMPLILSQLVQVGLPMASFGSMAQVAADFTWEQTIGNSVVVREPIGVVGAITPWNYPLHQIAAKVAPALAAGCTVVLKPSEVAPLNAFILAEIIDDVGLPYHVTLAVANRTASGDELLEALRHRAEQFTDATRRQLFVIVVPQEGGDGHAARRARTRLKLVLDRLHVRGLYAAGMIGDPDPYTAIMNTLQYFRVDDIVISTFPETKSGWLRADLIDRVRRATGKDVEHVVHSDTEATAA